jgi:hypothetical protein
MARVVQARHGCASWSSDFSEVRLLSRQRARKRVRAHVSYRATPGPRPPMESVKVSGMRGKLTGGVPEAREARGHTSAPHERPDGYERWKHGATQLTDQRGQRCHQTRANI